MGNEGKCFLFPMENFKLEKMVEPIYDCIRTELSRSIRDERPH